jgi:hypothetical protein
MLRRSCSWRTSIHISRLWWLLRRLRAYLSWIESCHSLIWHSSLVCKRSRIMLLHHWLWHSWFSWEWSLLWPNSTVRLSRLTRSHLSWLRSQKRFLWLLRCSLYLSRRSRSLSVKHRLFILQSLSSFLCRITVSKVMMKTIIKILFRWSSWLKLLTRILSLLLYHIHLVWYILSILGRWHRWLILRLLRLVLLSHLRLHLRRLSLSLSRS